MEYLNNPITLKQVSCAVSDKSIFYSQKNEFKKYLPRLLDDGINDIRVYGERGKDITAIYGRV